MCYRKVGKMPHLVGCPHGLRNPLRGTREIEYDTHQIKGQRIASGDLVMAASKGQQKVRSSCKHRDQHTHTSNDRNSLQPPGDSAEQEMMRTDQRIEQDLRPKSKDAQTVGIDRGIELLWQKIVGKTQVEQHEPHAD